jgi:hypothetical protein
MVKHHLQRSGKCFVWQMFEYSQDSATPLAKGKGQLPMDFHRMGGIDFPPFSGSARSVPPLARTRTLTGEPLVHRLISRRHTVGFKRVWMLVSCPRNSRYIVVMKMGRRQGGPGRTGTKGAYLNRYVTDEQRSRRPIFIATHRPGAS